MFRVCPAYGLVIPFCAISSVQFETDSTNLMILGRKMPFQWTAPYVGWGQRMLKLVEALSGQPPQCSPGDTEWLQIVVVAALWDVVGAAIEGLAGRLTSNGY